MRFLLAALLALVGCAASSSAEDAESSDEAISSGARPLYDFAFPAPTIVRDGAKYHAYFAKQTDGDGGVINIGHAVKTSDDGEWKYAGDVLPKLGAKAFQDGLKYALWAPAVAKISDGNWVLYYTATLVGTAEKKCIFRATADSANGPFVDGYADPIACNPGSLWAIDPYLVQDETGAWNLAARMDEPGGINTIQIRKLGPKALDFAAGSSWATLTSNSATSWEQPVLENAGIVRLTPPKGAPHWFVFYSGGAWADNSYAVGYADCGTNIDGPCVKKSVDGPWMATDAKSGVYGPGTPTFFTNESGHTLMSVQAWQFDGGKANKQNHGQVMRTYSMTIDDNYAPIAKLERVDL